MAEDVSNLNLLDTLLDWGSALLIILAGTKPEHLNMLEGGIIAKLLEEKWKTFAQVLLRISLQKL